MTVDRPKENIKFLCDEWKQRQTAIYTGKLANVPEHHHVNNADKLLEIVGNKVIRVKVSRIEKESVEFRLIDP